MCLEYEYKSLAAYSPLTITIPTPTEHVDFYTATSASRVSVQAAVLDSDVTSGPGSPTCAWPNCQPGVPGISVVDLPISQRVLGTPTATSAKFAEVAVRSGARRLGAVLRELERLIWVGTELAAVAGVMVWL